MAVAPTKYRDARADAPDLSHFRRNYPLTVANFGALPDREAWLRRVWQADSRWRARAEESAREAVVRSAPPAGLEAEADFDVIYAGGTLAVLHAGLMSCRHGRRALVLRAPEDEGRGRERGAAEEDLREFERAGLLAREEIEAAVVKRYRAGYVKFHDAASRVKAPPLWVSGVADVSVDAEQLAELAAQKLRARAGCAVVEGARFVRAYVERDRVSVEVEGLGGARRLFTARLFVDASGADSAVARQLNGGRAATHVRPSVGTVARGFARGDGATSVDFGVGEMLVSTEDASAHRQLLWEGFGRDERAGEFSSRLFFYDSLDSPADKSLLALFEQYFEKLPRYKRAGAQWRVVRPLYGHAAGSRPAAGWKSRRSAAAADRVLLACDTADCANPLAVSGFGAQLRSLGESARLVELALAADLLDERSLAEIGKQYAPRSAQAAGLAELLRPAPRGAPANVNETLNAVMAALHDLDERVRRELFRDSLSFAALRSLLARTLQLYPRLLQRVREHLGARGTLWWLAHAGEAAFAEHRARRAIGDGEGADRDGEPAREFARLVRLYEKGRGAGDRD
jgi:lycopene cyclase CruA